MDQTSLEHQGLEGLGDTIMPPPPPPAESATLPVGAVRATRKPQPGRIVRLHKDAEEAMDRALGKDCWFTSDVSLAIKYLFSVLDDVPNGLDDFRLHIQRVNDDKRVKSMTRRSQEDRRKKRRVESEKLDQAHETKVADEVHAEDGQRELDDVHL